MRAAVLLAAWLTAAPIPTVDTRGWETKKVSQLGKEKFKFEGRVKLPPKTTTTSTSTTVGDQKGEPIAFALVGEGVKVMLMQRGPEAHRDLGQLEALLATTGKVVVSRKDAKGYWLVIQREDGFVVQGANWSVAPGFDCATEGPLTARQVDVVDAICRSLSK